MLASQNVLVDYRQHFLQNQNEVASQNQLRLLLQHYHHDHQILARIEQVLQHGVSTLYIPSNSLLFFLYFFVLCYTFYLFEHFHTSLCLWRTSIISDAGTAADLSTLLAQPNTSTVYFWGSGVKVPALLTLPPSEQNIIQVSVGRTQKLGVTSNGRVLSWEVLLTIFLLCQYPFPFPCALCLSLASRMFSNRSHCFY